MNKRIRELALQAGYQADMFGIGHWDQPECQKFAELIIQECLLALEPNPMASEIEYDVEEKIYKRSFLRIQRHFDST